jgi:hypothetical protein
VRARPLHSGAGKVAQIPGKSAMPSALLWQMIRVKKSECQHFVCVGLPTHPQHLGYRHQAPSSWRRALGTARGRLERKAEMTGKSKAFRVGTVPEPVLVAGLKTCLPLSLSPIMLVPESYRYLAPFPSLPFIQDRLPHLYANAPAHLPGPPAITLYRAKPGWRPRSGAARG